MAVPRWFRAPKPWRNAILLICLGMLLCGSLLPTVLEQLHIYLDGQRDAGQRVCMLVESEQWNELMTLIVPVPDSVGEISSAEKLAAFFSRQARVEPDRLITFHGTAGMTFQLDLRYHWLHGYMLHHFLMKPYPGE